MMHSNTDEPDTDFFCWVCRSIERETSLCSSSALCVLLLSAEQMPLLSEDKLCFLLSILVFSEATEWKYFLSVGQSGVSPTNSATIELAFITSDWAISIFLKQLLPCDSPLSLGFWTSSSLQFFVFCHSLLQFAQLLVSGYMKSSISTIERRYGLSSQKSGVLAAFNEVNEEWDLWHVSPECWSHSCCCHNRTDVFVLRWETRSSSSSWVSLVLEFTDHGLLEEELCWPVWPPCWWRCHTSWAGHMNTRTASSVSTNTHQQFEFLCCLLTGFFIQRCHWMPHRSSWSVPMTDNEVWFWRGCLIYQHVYKGFRPDYFNFVLCQQFFILQLKKKEKKKGTPLNQNSFFVLQQPLVTTALASAYLIKLSAPCPPIRAAACRRTLPSMWSTLCCCWVSCSWESALSPFSRLAFPTSTTTPARRTPRSTSVRPSETHHIRFSPVCGVLCAWFALVSSPIVQHIFCQRSIGYLPSQNVSTWQKHPDTFS